MASRENVAPEELDPLYAAINPDALNEIFPSEHQRGTVVFSYMNYEVEVTSNGRVTLE